MSRGEADADHDVAVVRRRGVRRGALFVAAVLAVGACSSDGSSGEAAGSPTTAPGLTVPATTDEVGPSGSSRLSTAEGDPLPPPTGDATFSQALCAELRAGTDAMEIYRTEPDDYDDLLDLALKVFAASKLVCPEQLDDNESVRALLEEQAIDPDG